VKGADDQDAYLAVGVKVSNVVRVVSAAAELNVAAPAMRAAADRRRIESFFIFWGKLDGLL